MVEFLKANPELRVLLLAGSHNILNEIEQKFDPSEVTHWYGHEKGCPVREL